MFARMEFIRIEGSCHLFMRILSEHESFVAHTDGFVGRPSFLVEDQL